MARDKMPMILRNFESFAKKDEEDEIDSNGFKEIVMAEV
jgi:hypothetical protein